jgi:hypothetical protein
LFNRLHGIILKHTRKKQKRKAEILPLFSVMKLLFLGNSQNLTSVVGTAVLAGSMGQTCLATLGASNHAGHGELPMRATSLIPSCLGNFTLRDSHE